MPTTRRTGPAKKNSTPWVIHRRIIVDVDEIDKQSQTGRHAATKQTQVSNTVLRSNARVGNSLPRKDASKEDHSKSNKGIEWRATAARRFFLQCRDRSKDIERRDEVVESKPMPLTLTMDSVDTQRPCPEKVVALRDTQPIAVQNARSELHPSDTDELGEMEWVYSEPPVDGRVVGESAIHEGQPGKWYLVNNSSYSSQQNWLFIPEDQNSRGSGGRRPGRQRKDRINFLFLPGELRNQIYAQIIPENRICITTTKPNKELDKKKKAWSSRDVSHKRSVTKLGCILDSAQINQGLELTIALLLTCRKIRDDVEKYLYSRTTFCFFSSKVMGRFLGTASKPGLSAIRKVEITHQGYANPESTKDRVYCDKYYAKWLRTCTLFGNEMTGLEDLKLKITVRKWPCEFAALRDSKEVWRQACLQLAPRRIRKVEINLQHPMIQNNENVLIDLAHALEDDMMTKEGKELRDRHEHEQVMKAVRAQKRAERKARAEAERAELLASLPAKVLSITMDEVKAQKPVPVKVCNKGLEKYHRVDIAGICPEELEYFRSQYGAEKHKDMGSHCH